MLNIYTTEDLRGQVDAVTHGRPGPEWDATALMVVSRMQTRDALLHRVARMADSDRAGLLLDFSDLTHRVPPEHLSPQEVVGIGEVLAVLLWAVRDYPEASMWAAATATAGSNLGALVYKALSAGGDYQAWAEYFTAEVTEDDCLTAPSGN